MRFFLLVIIIAALSAIAEWFLPWWMIAVVAFIVSFLFALRPGKAFLAGFTGIAVFWLVAALWRDIPNEHILSSRMAVMFHLPSYSLFIAVTVINGGLVGGLAAWAGTLLKNKNPKPLKGLS